MPDNPNITAIIFDLDDTLHDFTPSERKARNVVCQRAAEELCVPFELIHDTYRSINSQMIFQWEDEKRMTTATIVEYRELVWRMTLDTLALTPDDGLCLRLSQEYENERLERVALYPDTIPCLDALSKHYPLALISNGFRDSQRPQTERVGLEKYFRIMLFEGELGFGKPDPRIFVKAVDYIGQPSSKTLMVGDSLTKDIAGAQTVGCKTCWINRDRRPLPPDSAAPDIMIRDLNELTNILI